MRATVRLCRIKEKCFKTNLKCVNGWSSSTVQWKRVPKSRSSNREMTSSSVQFMRRNWQKLLCGWSQQARLTVWADEISEVAWLLERSSQVTKFGVVWSWSAARLAASAGSVTVVQLMLSGCSCRQHGPDCPAHAAACQGFGWNS